MVGAGVIAFALGYLDLTFFNRGLAAESRPDDVPLQPHAPIQAEAHPDAFYVDPKTAHDPHKVKSALSLGDFYCREGKYDEAIAAYQDGLSADPGNTELQARVEKARKT